MFHFLKFSRLPAAGLLLSLCLGCGQGGPELNIAPAKGTVKLDGSPLPNAIVVFTPESDGIPATATTDENGRFTLTTKEPGDGAMVGKHKITVREKPPEPNETITSEEEYGPSDPNAKSRIPAMYARPDQSGLTEEVTASGDNDFTFELKSQ